MADIIIANVVTNHQERVGNNNNLVTLIFVNTNACVRDYTFKDFH